MVSKTLIISSIVPSFVLKFIIWLDRKLAIISYDRINMVNFSHYIRSLGYMIL